MANVSWDLFLVSPLDSGLSHGVIALIVIASFLGTIFLCCWIGSMIECIQHAYKNWCCCCENNPSRHSRYSEHFRQYRRCQQYDATVTTVIANQNADPSTLLVADTIPPSYSSIFCNGAASLQMSSLKPQQSSFPSTADASVQVNLIEYDKSKAVRWLWLWKIVMLFMRSPIKSYTIA